MLNLCVSLTRARHGSQGADGFWIRPDSAAASPGAPSHLAASCWQDGAHPSAFRFWAPRGCDGRAWVVELRAASV